jgi:hypothetical protein
MSTLNVPNMLLTTSNQWEYKPCKILTHVQILVCCHIPKCSVATSLSSRVL